MIAVMPAENAHDADLVADRILDAAVECFAEKGIGKTSMEDVARVARLARSGVYRYFRTKAELIDAALLRELGRYLHDLDTLSREGADVAEVAADGLVFTIQFIRGSVLLGELLLTNPEWLLPHLSLGGESIISAATEFLSVRMEQFLPGSGTSQERREVAETLVRVAMSFVLNRQSVIDLDDEQALRRYAKRVLVPLVQSLD